MAFITLVSLVLLLCSFARVAYRWHRLRHIPGPFWTSFLAKWHIPTRTSYLWPLDLERLFDEYGELIRVGPNQLVTSDIETILRINSPSSGYSGGPNSGSKQNRQVGFSCSDEKCIQLDAPTHRYKGDSHFEEVIDRQCGRLIRLIEQEYMSTDVTPKSLEMPRTSRWLMSNVLRDLATSQHSGSLEEYQSGSHISKTKRRYLSRFMAALRPRWFKPAHCCSYGPGVYSEESANQLNDTGCDADEKIVSGLPRNIQQWADQTADALTTILLHIVSSPTAYGKLRAEIRSAAMKSATKLSVAHDTPSSPPDFPYLQAVVKEGCRMSSAATTTINPLARSVAMTGDEIILGFHVPGGTEVGPDVPGIMRATRYWGPDAEACRPERWLEAQSEEVRAAMESALDILWGDVGSSGKQEGGYGHLGKSAAEALLGRTVATILARYDLSLAEPCALLGGGQPGQSQQCIVRFVPASWGYGSGTCISSLKLPN